MEVLVWLENTLDIKLNDEYLISEQVRTIRGIAELCMSTINLFPFYVYVVDKIYCNLWRKEMSRFNDKGYFVKENAPIYFTLDMNKTAEWFEKIMGWYSNIVERDNNGNGAYGVVFDMLPEIETTHLAPFTGFQMFCGTPESRVISFMQVQDIKKMHEYITSNGWDKITEVVEQPWGGKTCSLTTLDGYIINIFE